MSSVATDSGPKIVGIVPARLDSSRLPGKALLQVNGVPLIGYVLKRARRIVGLSALVIATSARRVDDPLEKFGRVHGVPIFRGSLDDVAGRLLSCARLYEADYFIRLNGDSPFLDPDLIDQGIALCLQSGADLVTNLIGRTFPHGIAVEIVRTAAFECAYASMDDPQDREHVTRYLYYHSEAFRIEAMVSPAAELSKAHMTVDTPADFKAFERLVGSAGEAFFTMNYQQVAERILAERGTE